MKVIVVIALIVAFAGGYLVARAKYKPQIVELYKMVKDKDTALQQIKTQTNKVTMEDDKMWIVENGESREMKEEVTLTNGDLVAPDGKITKKDGTVETMRNGDNMDMNGNLMRAESNDEM